MQSQDYENIRSYLQLLIHTNTFDRVTITWFFDNAIDKIKKNIYVLQLQKKR